LNNKTGRFSILMVIFLVILAVLVYLLLVKQPPRQISLIEARYLKTFPSLNYQSFRTSIKRLLKGNINEASSVFLGQFIDRSFQKKVENATTDQFPFRLPLIQFSKAIDRKLIELAYSPFSDLAIPAAMNSGILIMRDGSRLIDGPGVFDENTKKNIDLRIENFQTLVDQYPDKTFYIFYHERVSLSKYHPSNHFYFNSDRGQIFEYFQKKKPIKVMLGALLFSNFEDLSENYYKTDHHWNIHGIQKAYNGIYKMLSENFPSISPALDLNNLYRIPDIEFSGSYSRLTMYPIPGEKFEIAKINLPHYKIVSDTEERENNQGGGYSPSNYSKEKYTNYYGIFFGEDKDLSEFLLENGSTRNLLIIGSSFSRPLVPLLAYHYHQTYYIDLRDYENFSFSEFISSHPVDDVIFVTDGWMLTSDIWKINP